MTEKILVDLAQGKLLGTKEGQIQAFYDIPYGHFVGRFKYVEEPKKWQGTRPADKPGPIFNQGINRLGTVMGSKEEESNQSEDAFRLNIWTSGSSEKKPVLFWIHGGGFLTGGGALPWYNGQSLAEHGDIVVVNVNYRLGALGNLYLPGIADENLALDDLITALNWVKENISAFGGDPDQLTVAGQSAGAWYSLALFASPKANKLFKRIGLFSLPGSVEPLTREKATVLSKILIDKLGIDDKEKIKNIPVQRIVKAQSEVALEMQRRTGDYVPTAFVPNIDDNFLEGPILDEAIAYANKNLQIFAGTTSNETTAFFHKTPLANQENYLELIKKSSDYIFQSPTEILMEKLSDQNSEGYLYEMAVTSKDPKILACHCIDLPFIFNNFDYWDNAPMLVNMNKIENLSIAQKMQSYFTRFIKTGNPNQSGELKWPVFTNNHPEKIIFDQEFILQKMNS